MSSNYQRRRFTDRLATWSITSLGIGTGSIVCLILVYLFYISFPLLVSSSGWLMEGEIAVDQPLDPASTIAFAPQGQHIGFLSPKGQWGLLALSDGEVLDFGQVNLFDWRPQGMLASLGEQHSASMFYDDQGNFQFYDLKFQEVFINADQGDYHTFQQKLSTQALTAKANVFDFVGDTSRADSQKQQRVKHWSARVEEERTLLAVHIADFWYVAEYNQDEASWQVTFKRSASFAVQWLWPFNSQTLLASSLDGQMTVLSQNTAFPDQQFELPLGKPSAFSPNLGGDSLVMGDQLGGVHLLGLVEIPKGDGGEFIQQIQVIRSYQSGSDSIVSIHPEPNRKGFITLDGAAVARGYYQPLSNSLYELALPFLPWQVATSKHAEQWLLVNEQGQSQLMGVQNHHPEVSLAAQFSKVWYEGYQQPEWVWQSTAALTNFEPKLSLVPLLVGTLKGAFYAMLFALPLAIFGACYTARFMSPAFREIIKPSVEIFGSFPTVIIGFVAALWVAPMVEKNLLAVFAFMFWVPILSVGSILLVRKMPLDIKWYQGKEFLLVIPAIFLAYLLATPTETYIETMILGQSTVTWLSEVWGIDYQQRNGLIVGIMMGIAVIPLIFSISEDAFYSVPDSLVRGALALGATPWQVAKEILFPMAAPGLFSATMMGLGRAIGETMIVMMAAGNTALTDFSLWTGMRTLSANIAVEMPEAEIDSTHYRLLFLSAVLLLTLTFFANTVAEIVRQRLRAQYSNL